MENDEGCQDIGSRSLESIDSQHLDGDGDDVLRLPRKRAKTSEQMTNTIKQTSRTCKLFKSCIIVIEGTKNLYLASLSGL